MTEASYNFLLSVPFLVGAIAFGIAGLISRKKWKKT